MATVKKSLKKFHQRLYEKAKEEALSYAEYRNETIQRYSREYQASLPNNFNITTLEDLLTSLFERGLFIYGDFHTLKQAQKGLVRLLKALRIKKPNCNIILCLEMFKYSQQSFLNSYLAGLESEQTLLKLTEYQHNWGFPWENYRGIVEFAKLNKIKLVGINSKLGGKDSMGNRDKFASDIISKLRTDHPDHIIGCLIGEYHLGDKSLIGALSKENIKPVRIFTNVDKYYFKSPLSPGHHTEYLFLKEGSYCILNSPPWIKWQSYCIWEEMRSSIENTLFFDDCDDYVYTEDVFDIDFQLTDLLSHLCRFLGIGFSINDISRFAVVSHPEQNVFSKLKIKHRIDQSSINQAITRLATDGFYFEERTNNVLITDITYNNLARISGQYIHNMHRKYSLQRLDEKEAFCYRCLNIASGEVAAKILNPRMKSPNLEFYQIFKKMHKNKKLHGTAKIRKDSIDYLLKFCENIATKAQPLSKLLTYSRHDKYLNHNLSLLLGGIMGDAIYNDAIGQNTKIQNIKDLFKSGEDPNRIKKRFLSLYRSGFNLKAKS